MGAGSPFLFPASVAPGYKHQKPAISALRKFISSIKQSGLLYYDCLHLQHSTSVSEPSPEVSYREGLLTIPASLQLHRLQLTPCFTCNKC